MLGFLVFAITLLLAVLVSGLAQRSILSTAVLFFAAGFLAGHGTLGILHVDANSEFVSHLAEVSLFTVLFSDGMKLSSRELKAGWHLPGRALVLGMPITLLITAALAHYVAGLPWVQSLLIGAVLSPTDPVLVSAIVGRQEVPERLRRLLNIESGFNDGLALPVVIVLIGVAGHSSFSVPDLLLEIGMGIVLGIVIPWTAIKLERSQFFSATGVYRPLGVLAIGMLLYAVANLSHANAFLAAFTGGITIATISEKARDVFREFGELLSELLQLAAILVFAALLSVQFLREIPVSGYLFAVLVLVVPRGMSILLSLAGTDFPWPQRWVAAWFGPKGFASVLYTLWVVHAGVGRADDILHLSALVVAGSIIAHSSTDVLVADWLSRRQAGSGEPQVPAEMADTA
jgi:sodium/hydrogen antiporter